MTYNVSSGQTETKVTGLRCPNRITRFTNSSSVFYIVNESKAQRILIYDEKWQLINTITRESTAGYLRNPLAFTISPISTLWVADRLHPHVLEVTLKGEWIHYISVGINGVHQPWSIAYNPQHPNYIWLSDHILNGERDVVKRFKIDY